MIGFAAALGLEECIVFGFLRKCHTRCLCRLLSALLCIEASVVNAVILTGSRAADKFFFSHVGRNWAKRAGEIVKT